MAMIVGVVGTGAMGSALVRGWLRESKGQVEVVVHDLVDERKSSLAANPRVRAAASLEDLAARSEVIVVVVKPKDIVGVLGDLSPWVSQEKTVVSAAAGVSLDRLRAALGPGPELLRIMPNLGVELGEGVLALCPEPGTAPDTIESAVRLFADLGVVEVFAEDGLDAVTAVAGSSIGFFALLLEGMEDGAVEMGMPRATARTFVRQTALAASLLLLREEGSAADLKNRVASPGGTTLAGLRVLEEKGVRGALMQAIEKATERSRGLRDVG